VQSEGEQKSDNIEYTGVAQVIVGHANHPTTVTY
jgi:hypothetical protein